MRAPTFLAEVKLLSSPPRPPPSAGSLWVSAWMGLELTASARSSSRIPVQSGHALGLSRELWMQLRTNGTEHYRELWLQLASGPEHPSMFSTHPIWPMLLILKPKECRKFKKPDEMHMAGKLDIETRWAQEVVERHRGAGEIRILKQHKRKKLWRGQRGEAYIWNQMDAGSCWGAPGGKRRLDIETRWAQQVAERWGVKPRHWTQMTKNAKSCGETGGPRYWN